MKSSDDPRVIAVRQAAVAQQAVRRHEPGQERSLKDLKDRARAAAKRAKKMGARVNPEKVRESVETSVIDCYLKFAGAIAEGSMSPARQMRKVRSMAKRTGAEIHRAEREGRHVDAAKANQKGFNKAKPHLMRVAYKKKESEDRNDKKADIFAAGSVATGDVEGIAKQIPTGGQDATQTAGRKVAKKRRGVKGAVQVGRAINRAQSKAFNFERKAAMDKEAKAETERRNRRKKDSDPSMN
jgi:hypothetical protein